MPLHPNDAAAAAAPQAGAGPICGWTRC